MLEVPGATKYMHDHMPDVLEAYERGYLICHECLLPVWLSIMR